MTPASGEARAFRAYGWILRRLYAWAFLPVSVPPGASHQLRSLAAQGTVVYVGRSAALVTFVYFQQLFVRLGAPVADAIQGLGISVWRPWGRLVAGRRTVRAPYKENVVGAVKDGRSAMVFLRGSGSLTGQMMLEVRDQFPALVALQRQTEKPIFLVPQLLVWERRPRKLRRSIWDVLFGEVDAPGFFRSLFALLWNRHRAFVKFGEPINLKKVIADFSALDDAKIARRVRGALHQHLARETRVITGPPIKSADRLIEETLRDRTLRSTLAEVARERGRADGSVEQEAEKDLREIAARFSPRMIDFMRWALDYVFNKIYDGILYEEKDIQQIAATSSHNPIIVCPGHKSHIDYLILSYVFHISGLSTPHIAAGINLNFFPLGTIFRKSGAFFIRRSFKNDKVYSAVLKAYVRMLLRDGFTQEFFVEGSRSRTGKVLMPKFGMVSMEVEAWLDKVRPDVAFVPTSIAYERIIEGKSYAAELAGGEKKAEDLGQLLQARKVLTSRYGRIHIRFDKPILLTELARQRGIDPANCTDEQKRVLVKTLGFRIIEGINRVTALTPSALLCSALLATDRRGLTQPELMDRMAFLLKLVVDSGGLVAFENGEGALDPSSDSPIHEALLPFEKDKSMVVHQTGNERIYSAPDQHRVALDFYKNSSIHFFAADALIATCILTTESEKRSAIEWRTQEFSRHFKQEFVYGAGGFAQLFARRIAHLASLGLIEASETEIRVTEAGRERIRLLADLTVNFVEAYIAANDALSLLLKVPMERKDLIKQAMDRMRAGFLAGRVRRFESVSKVNFENAFDLFEEQGILTRSGEKGRLRALGPTQASQEFIDGRVAAMRSFLIPKADS